MSGHIQRQRRRRRLIDKNHNYVKKEIKLNGIHEKREGKISN